jgi:hypothetical protein
MNHLLGRSFPNTPPGRNGFGFDRLEDIASHPEIQGRTFVADTGKPPTTARGRVYQFDVNPANPMLASIKMILNGRRSGQRRHPQFDVQAHSTTAPQPGPSLAPNSSSGEEGQFLALYVPGSQGPGGGHDG